MYQQLASKSVPKVLPLASPEGLNLVRTIVTKWLPLIKYCTDRKIYWHIESHLSTCPSSGRPKGKKTFTTSTLNICQNGTTARIQRFNSRVISCVTDIESQTANWNTQNLEDPSIVNIAQASRFRGTLTSLVGFYVRNQDDLWLQNSIL